VRIEAGPLQGLEAMFDRTVSATGRVRILLDILGRLTACEIESDWLEKVR
jgi:transcription antitermination factor NusG